MSTLPLVIPHDLFTCLLVLVDPILSSDAHFIFWNLIIYLWLYCLFSNTSWYVQADEDHDDGDERWDPESDMEVDEEQYFVSPLNYLSHSPVPSNLCFTCLPFLQ